MGSITVLRPSATSSGVGWTPSAGTLHGVTSDDSDATYATWSGSGSAMILATPVDAPPAGERRHQVRMRARGEDGNAWWAVRLSSGGLIAGAAALFGSSPETVIGSWGTGVPPDISTTLYAYVTGQSTGVRITELYIDVDSRLAPTFTPQVLDGSGSSTLTVSDTSQPVIHADSLDTDDLAVYQYRYWVTISDVIVWDTGIVSGAPVNQQTTPLDNGAYLAHLQIWSTLGANTAYASDEETLNFTIAVGAIPAPDNPIATPVDGTPLFLLEACAPYVGDLDDEVGYIQIERVDCNSSVVVAILGPLGTGECAEYTDFSFPRTGMGATCDHAPEPCCSYYRARVVGSIDGDLRISNWSDFFDPAVPLGVITMWPSTEASIPDGWNRLSALNGRFIKGIPNVLTEPGSTGGASAHSHTTPSHTHGIDHFHTAASTTASATGTVNAPNTAGALKALTSHTHTRPPTDNTSGFLVSGSSSPGSDTENNDPAKLTVIWIQSDNTSLGIPNGALGMHLNTSVTGWTDYSNAADRFFKGAAAAGNGGAVAAGTLDSHVHAINAHTHAGVNHTHTSADTGNFSSTLAPAAGSGSVISAASHNHIIDIASSNSQTLASASGGNSSASGSLDPLYRNLRVKENTSGDVSLPVGLICAWRGSIGSIPGNWQLCDGTNSTPDMFGRYPRGATSSINGSGGSSSPHTHTSSTHTHTTTGHSHTSTTFPAGTTNSTANTTATVAIATAGHTHALSDVNSTTPTVVSSTSNTLESVASEPLYEEVAFIQMMSEPTPPPDPEVFCLTWDDDEHLIRTTGPDGPMWAPVLGKFEWGVERPFTAAAGVMGTRFVTSAPPGGRNLSMTAAVESEAELAELRAVLARPLVLISPSDASEVWATPVQESVRIVKIGRIRQVSAAFIGTGPQPPPQTADIGV